MTKKSSNKEVIYGHVRCEKKTCANKYKPLKVPKILIGKQKCQVCKNVMQKVRLDKNAEVIHNKKSEVRVIDYVYKNFDVKKIQRSRLLMFFIYMQFSQRNPQRRYFNNVDI